MKRVDFLIDLISMRWISKGYKHKLLFLRAFLKNELRMNAHVGYASRKVEKNSGLIGSIWEKHIYFNFSRPEAANTEPDLCPKHS